MSEDFSFKELMDKGSIIDNRRVHSGKKVTLKDVLINMAEGSKGLKTAVGYFYIEGLAQIINSLKQLKEIKILMGGDTSPKTKKELIRAFTKKFDEIEKNETTTAAVKLFHTLIKESKVLKARVYLGENGKLQRLHSKGYLFLRDVETDNPMDRYYACVIGSSNLTPSGLMGNTELNMMTTNQRSMSYLESWFDELWEHGTEEFEKLRVADALTKAIEESKFGAEIDEAYKYMEPKEFFKSLIKFLNADYLFEDWKKSGLFGFQVVDTNRCLRLFKENKYRSVFLTSSVGLGKSYVATKVAEIFMREGNRVLIIAPANLAKGDDQWPRYLKEFKLWGKVDLVSMGEFQKDPKEFFDKRVTNYATSGKIKLEKENKYGLIIVDEAHNFRNNDAYRTRNLKRLIDLNGDSKIMFLTATPINTSLNDLLSLIELFHRPGQNLVFDAMVRDLKKVIDLAMKKEFEELTNNEKEELAKRQEEVEKELFIKSTRETIKTNQDYIQQLKEFSGVDLTTIPDPEVIETEYTLHANYRPIVNNIVDFISSLSAAHLRMIDPEKGRRLGGFFKWLLYKRFESSITAYYLTLKRLAKRNQCIQDAIENRDVCCLDIEYEDDVEINFTFDFREKLEKVIEKIKKGKGQEQLKILDDLKSDTERINNEIEKLQPFVVSDLCFENDYKLDELYKIVKNNQSKKILLFTQYKDTLKAIEKFLKSRISNDVAKYVSSEVENKNRIIEKFNDKRSKLSLLCSTDALSEGFNISGADVVINFDIPYNPVRIIQRIGRATRLDNPKKIDVFNFKPDEDIDRELELVDRMDLRIKDIINFVGVEYRVWIDRENEIRTLLKERRLKDTRIYQEVMKSIRSDFTKGKFENLEVEIQYAKPTLAFLQKTIKKFGITREDVENQNLPFGNNYTTIKGKKGLIVYYNSNDVFNEEYLHKAKMEKITRTINFEKDLNNYLQEFDQYLETEKRKKLCLNFYNSQLDRKINNILDIIELKNLSQLYSNIDELIFTLNRTKESCGSTTARVIKELEKRIKKDEISDKLIKELNNKIKNSFTQKHVQEKLINETTRKFAIALLEE